MKLRFTKTLGLSLGLVALGAPLSAHAQPAPAAPPAPGSAAVAPSAPAPAPSVPLYLPGAPTPPPPGAPPANGQAYPPGYAPVPQPGPLPPGFAPVPNNAAIQDVEPHRLPERMEFIPGAQIPPGYRVDTQPRFGLAAAGWITFGALYTSSAITAGFIIDNRDGGGAALFAPVLGPFITIGTLGASASGGVLLVFDGLGQAAGLAMGIAGFAAPKKMIVRTQYGSFHVAPFAAPTGPAMGLVGDF